MSDGSLTHGKASHRLQQPTRKCPVCELDHQRVLDSSYIYRVDCRRCGKFSIDLDLVEDLAGEESQRRGSRIRFSHYIRRMKRDISPQSLPYTQSDFDFALEKYVASSVREQFDDALLALSAISSESIRPRRRILFVSAFA
jgi:hypothetical protein